MIIYTRRKKKKRTGPRTRPLSLAEQQARRLEGKDPNMTFKGKKLYLERYTENGVFDFKKQTYEVDSLFGVSGLYFLFDKGLNVVYIGESRDCVKRISQHFDEGVKNFSFFKIYRFDGTDTHRKAIERKLIKRYNPQYNKQHNSF